MPPHVRERLPTIGWPAVTPWCRTRPRECFPARLETRERAARWVSGRCTGRPEIGRRSLAPTPAGQRGRARHASRTARPRTCRQICLGASGMVRDPATDVVDVEGTVVLGDELA